MGNSSSKKNSATIATCNAPAYCIKSMGSRHALIGGGGGAAKTGVANNIEILLLTFDCLNPPSSSFTNPDVPLHAYTTKSIKTDPHATMNIDVAGVGPPESGRYLIAAGHDEFCDIYESTGFTLNEEKDRRNMKDVQLPRLSFKIEKICQILTDECPGRAYQKVVRFDRSTVGHPRRLVTGGADGKIRIWDVDKFRNKDPTTIRSSATVIPAHQGDIDDLDISPDGNVLITVGHDAKVYIWDIKQSKKLMDLLVPPELDDTFRVRSVRFTNLGSANIIFVAAYNHIRRSPKSISYLVLWAYNTDRRTCKPIVVKMALKETISALAVSSCGNFTAVGTLGGSVAIFDTHEMKRLYYAFETHGIFVTGVDFLPRRTIDVSMKCEPGKPLPICPGVASEYRAAVLSLSADQSIQFHSVPFTPIPSLTMFFLKLSIFATFLYYFIWFLVPK